MKLKKIFALKSETDAVMEKQNGSIHQSERIYNNILEVIGNTPMVRLNKIPKDYGLECEIYVKCEFLNPGGSIKDRICYAMIKDAEEKGLAKPGTTFVEPTSGNTGIGTSMTAAVLGYGCTIVTPDKNSDEKMSTMNVLGAEVIQTPAMAPYGDPRNFASVVRKILEDDPNTMSCDQYDNDINPMEHYKHTAEEILSAMGELDMIVMGAGTGGTLTGVSRKVKERCPKCVVVAVDPEGSIMFKPGTLKPFFVEGIGGDFVPKVLDKTHVDKVVYPNDYESFNMSRELIRKEGLLCGGSSGAAMFSAIKAAQELNLGAGKRVVVILPDGIRNYMTKFVNDQWMEANLFKNPPERNFIWWNRAITNLVIDRSVPHVSEGTSCRDAIAAMGNKHNVAFVVNNEGLFEGVITKNSLRSEATNPKRKHDVLDLSEPVNEHLVKTYYKIVENCKRSTVGLVSRILDIAPYVIVVEQCYLQKNTVSYIPKGIVTSDIVLEFINKHQTHI